MRKEYDFTKARRSPYAKLLKRPITIRLDEPTIDYFRTLAAETAIPYQTLINLYLRNCKEKGLEFEMEWKKHA